MELEPYDSNSELNKMGAFYATNYYPINKDDNSSIILKEILVYLTQEQHGMWRLLSRSKNESKQNDKFPSFFYDQFISDIIEPDTYYEEGIMNA